MVKIGGVPLFSRRLSGFEVPPKCTRPIGRVVDKCAEANYLAIAEQLIHSPRPVVRQK